MKLAIAIAMAGALTLVALPGLAAEHIKIGVVRSSGGIPAIVGTEKGFFTAQGVDAELVFFDQLSRSRSPSLVAIAISARPELPRRSTTSPRKAPSRLSRPGLGTGRAFKVSG